METAKFVDTGVSKSSAALLREGDHRTLVLWATDCTEHVLPYFEAQYPQDNQPHKAIEAGRAWVRGEIAMSEARAAAFAAHAAARDTNQAAACAVARAAGQAAATAHVVGHAVHSATDAADPTDADAGTTGERNWQFQRLLALDDNH